MEGVSSKKSKKRTGDFEHDLWLLLQEPPKFRTNLFIAFEAFKIDLQEVSLPNGGYETDTMMAGSAAEFSVDSMPFDCIGDIDCMTWNKLECAFFNFDPDDLIETEHFMHERTKIYDLMPYEHYPGYVRVEEYGYVFCITEHKFIIFLCSSHADKIRYQTYEAANYFLLSEIHSSWREAVYRGPSFKVYSHSKRGVWYSNFDADNVFCLRCPFWPPDASEWKTRRRNYQWPDPLTIDMVV